MEILNKLVCLAILLILLIGSIGAGVVGAYPPADTAPPTSFSLLSPKNNETIWGEPASYKQPFMADQLRWCQEHGVHFADSSTLEWEPSSDDGSGLDRYEVWLDGRNVENLPPETTEYPTMVAQGHREWYVVAVDKAGNERRSEETFGFEYRLCYTPPMGFSTYNYFRQQFDEDIIKGIADAMVSGGMKDAGYEYVNIDGGWSTRVGSWPENGPLHEPNLAKFPNGMKSLADYIHSKGLKFGMYTRHTGYMEQMVGEYASWDVDYLKDDSFNTPVFSGKFHLLSELLENCGRPIVYSLHSAEGKCGAKLPPREVRLQAYQELSEICNLWRTSCDIQAYWESIMTHLDLQVGFEEFNGPGHWNDPDMLEVGNGFLTTTESKSHFSLWCILAAPLIAGNDLRNMDPAIREILTNKEVIAVDQDPLGVQGDLVASDPENNWQIWAKPLIDVCYENTVAVVLFNRSEEPLDITAKWSDIRLPPKPARVRDLWEHRDVGVFENSFTATVEPHGVVMVRIGIVTPPKIEVINISLSKENVSPGEEVTVSVDVRNLGGFEGTDNIELSVNGEVVQRKSVTLPPEGIGTVTFTLSEDKVGTYHVSVGGLTESLEVVSGVEPATYKWFVDSEGGWQDATGYLNGTSISITTTPVEGHFLWAIGGKLELMYCLNDTTVYSIDEDKWYHVSPIPHAVQGAGWTLYENKIYCFGGKSEPKSNPTAYVQVYDMWNDEWKVLDNMPKARSKLGKFYPPVNGKVYLFGGDNATELQKYRYARVNWNWVYDLENDTWDTSPADAPYSQTFPVVTYENGWLYYTSGNSDNARAGLNQRYNPSTDTWGVVAPMPDPQTDGAGDKWNGEIHVLGGWDTESGIHYDKHWVYNYSTNSWSYAPDLPSEWHHQGVRVGENYLWMYLGTVGEREFPHTNEISYWDGDSWVQRTPAPVAKMNFGTIYSTLGPTTGFGLVLSENAVEGTWMSKVYDFSTSERLVVDNLKFAARVRSSGNLWGCITSDTDNDGNIDDNTGWVLLNDMGGIWDNPSVDPGYRFQVGFKLETNNSTHSPTVWNYMLRVKPSEGGGVPVLLITGVIIVIIIIMVGVWMLRKHE